MHLLNSLQTGHEKRDKARLKKKLDTIEKRERRQLEKTLKKEADFYAEILTKTAWNREYRQILRGALAPSVIEWWLGASQYRKLKFTHLCANEYEIWLRIDSRDLPGISHADLYHADFIEDLKMATNREVSYRSTPSAGAFFVVSRDSSISGIPTYLSMKKAFRWVPADADPLAFCMGQAANAQPLIVSLLTLPHLLVSGTTRQGKSVQVNNILSTLTLRNTPETVQFALIDFKAGLEFGVYAGLPHMFDTPGTEERGLAYYPNEFELVLNHIIIEKERRGKLFRAEGVRNIEEYHQIQDKVKLPFLVCAIDEISLLMFNENKNIQRMGRALLNDVTATGAAFGIHIIGATQDPTREVLPRIIKNNFTGRCAFRSRSIASSIAVLENMGAYKLKGKGRGLFQLDEEIEFQGPFISTATVKSIVRKTIEYYLYHPNAERRAELGLRDLLLYALDNRRISDTEFSLAWKPLALVFSPQGLSAGRITSMIESAHDREFEIDNQVYKVVQARGRKGTCLVWQRSIEQPTSVSDDIPLAAD